MRVSDWSSDVCSSDLEGRPGAGRPSGRRQAGDGACRAVRPLRAARRPARHPAPRRVDGGGRAAARHRSPRGQDRKGVVEGKRVSVSVDLGGRRNIKTKYTQEQTTPKHYIKQKQ